MCNCEVPGEVSRQLWKLGKVLRMSLEGAKGLWGISLKTQAKAQEK